MSNSLNLIRLDLEQVFNARQKIKDVTLRTRLKAATFSAVYSYNPDGICYLPLSLWADVQQHLKEQNNDS